MSKYHKGLLKVSVRNFSWSLLFIEITSSAKLKYDCRCNIPHLSTAARYIFDLSVALSDCSTSQHVKTRAIAVTITVDHMVGLRITYVCCMAYSLTLLGHVTNIALHRSSVRSTCGKLYRDAYGPWLIGLVWLYYGCSDHVLYVYVYFKDVCSYYCVSLEVGKQDEIGTMCDTTIETVSARLFFTTCATPTFSRSSTDPTSQVDPRSII